MVWHFFFLLGGQFICSTLNGCFIHALNWQFTVKIKYRARRARITYQKTTTQCNTEMIAEHMLTFHICLERNTHGLAFLSFAALMSIYKLVGIH